MTRPIKPRRKTKSEPLLKSRRNKSSAKAILDSDAHYYLVVKDQDKIQLRHATGNVTNVIVPRESPKRSPCKITKTDINKNQITANKIYLNNATELYQNPSQAQFRKTKHNITDTTKKTNSKCLISVIFSK